MSPYLMGNMTRSQILSLVNSLEKKHGKEEFEKHIPFETKWELFKIRNNLHYDQKEKKWNKPIISTGKNTWVTTRGKNWNRYERKYGYWQYVHIGWKILDKETGFKCKWCGKLLTLSKQKFCPNTAHRKLYSKVINDGKRRHGFDPTKNNHILTMPRLYTYDITESGAVGEKPSQKKRIEFRDIKFVINGREYPYTKKSRTVKPKK